MPSSDPPSNPFDSAEAYYASSRPGYGTETIEYLVERFSLDGNTPDTPDTSDIRVLDLGCGTGQLTVPLAAHVDEVVGMDPNETMLRYARQRADDAGCSNVRWVVGSDATLADHTDDLAPLRLTTMGRSFHWMNQSRTLDTLFELTEPGGGVALITDREWLTKGSDEWQEGVYDRVCGFVADVPDRVDPETVEYDVSWVDLLSDHGFDDVETTTIPLHREWTVESVVGYVFSLSFCSPSTVGDDADALEAAVRAHFRERDDDVFVQHTEVECIAGKK